MTSCPKAPRRSISTGVAAVMLACAVGSCAVQGPQPAPGQPVQAQGAPQAAGLQPAQPVRFNLRQLFVGTVAAVVEGVGVGLSAGLTQRVTGSILNWFGRPPAGSPDPYLVQAPQTYPAPPAQDPYATQQPYPSPPAQDPHAGQYPSPPAQDPQVAQGAQPYQYPAPPPQDPYTAPAPSVQYPADPATPTYPAPPGDPYGSQAAPAFSADGRGLFAGIAFEVHALGSGGASTPVDVNSYSFATGERFVVHYRPTLPGVVTVFNVNPLGRETRIDAINVAAGQLATLGPYEFRDTKGQETLRLQLTPCRTDALLVATRDIVKVDSGASSAGMNLAECSAVATRSADIRTRDIVKVGVEENTSFALDPVLQQEVASGQFAARELTIVFRHH